MTQPQHLANDLTGLPATLTPEVAAVAAARLRSIAMRKPLMRARARLIAWADALDAAADLCGSQTPQEAAASTERLRMVAENESASRGGRPRAVEWADALTAAAAIVSNLPRS